MRARWLFSDILQTQVKKTITKHCRFTSQSGTFAKTIPIQIVLRFQRVATFQKRQRSKFLLKQWETTFSIFLGIAIAEGPGLVAGLAKAHRIQLLRSFSQEETTIQARHAPRECWIGGRMDYGNNTQHYSCWDRHSFLDLGWMFYHFHQPWLIKREGRKATTF